MNVATHVETVARQRPDHPALIFEGRPVSYADLDRRASRFAAAMAHRGLGRGDRIAILLPNTPELVIAYLGIQKLGAISVSVNSFLKRGEVEDVLADCGAKLLVTDPEGLARTPLDALPELEQVVVHGNGDGGRAVPYEDFVAGGRDGVSAVDLPASAPAAIVYSSGTTGVPKGVTLSQGNLDFNSQAKIRYLGIRSDDRLLLFVPLFHCFGQNAIMNAGFCAGATLVLHRKFDLDKVLESVRSDGVTLFFAVPTVFILILQRTRQAHLSRVRYCFSAAATLPPEIASRWRERFSITIYEGYGLTETSPFACYNHERQHRLGSIGSPIEGVEMKIADPETGADLPPGETGEILIRGPNVMLGYWNRPQETAAAMPGGWLRSGDLGRVDADGYFYLVDRLKDMINVGGLKVFPAEVENVIFQHAGVAEAAVYAGPDPITGERVLARVVRKPEARMSVRELQAHCRERVADYKVPAEIDFVESLPKNPTGKILRRELRHAARSG